MHRLCYGIQEAELILPGESDNSLIPTIYDNILVQVTCEQPFGSLRELSRVQTFHPFPVRKSIDTVPCRPFSIALVPTHQRTRLILPVESVGECADGYVGDFNPAPWLEVLETPLDQRRPVANSADEDSKAYEIVAFSPPTCKQPWFLDIGCYQRQVLELE